MPDALVIRNSQRTRRIDTLLLQRILLEYLNEILTLPSYQIGIHLVSAKKMARINMEFLQHEGSTDVITFDHGDTSTAGIVFGEIFISVNDAVQQAVDFGTNWQTELVRYTIHGVLHLQGFDDMSPTARRLMKREENRCLRILARRFSLEKIEKR